MQCRTDGTRAADVITHPLSLEIYLSTMGSQQTFFDEQADLARHMSCLSQVFK